MHIESVEDIDTLAVVGAGEMGRGIAAVSALAGYPTTLHDIEQSQLDTARESIEWSYSKLVESGTRSRSDVNSALERIDYTDSLEAAADESSVIIEAAVEKQAVKKDIFESLDKYSPEDAILATNTSGLNITEIAKSTDRPAAVVGTHWFNPPMLMDLVEVIETEHTSPEVVEVCTDLVEEFGKTPIRCRKDIPMFVVNRCMRPYFESATWLVHHDWAEITEIDSAMKHREGFPMGPFELTDYTGGIQVRVESEQDHLEDDRPLSYDTPYCPLIHELYDAGHYGRKTGKGFYDYSDQDEPTIPEDAGEDFEIGYVWAPVINEATKLIQHDVTTVEDIDTGMKLGGNWPTGPFEKADEIGLDYVVQTCVELANMHDSLVHTAEVLPCSLLVEMAKSNETFY